MTLRTILIASTALGAALMTGPAFAGSGAATQAEIDALKQQVEELDQKIEDLQVQTGDKIQKMEAAQTSDGHKKSGVKVTVGGFIEAAGIFRQKNETSDIGSDFNTGIPFNNVVNAHQTEYRGSGRQSRLSLLAEGQVSDDLKLSAYFESDFLGVGTSSNSVESNSYTPRLRLAYAQADDTILGLHFVGGQAWSLVTLTKVGITPRQEDTPLTIDAQYVPGFNWTRNAQLRFVKDWDQQVWFGLSFESPQVNFKGITPPGAFNATNSGNSLLNNSTTYSTDVAPDIIAKLAFDPGWGHYEVFGITRFFHDNVNFQNNTVTAFGGGAGMILPVIPKILDFQANFMAGQGIGRYGSAQLPDIAFAPNGTIKPLTEVTALLGLIAHPDPSVDIYTYAGEEKIDRQNELGTTYGYGDYALNNSGCDIEAGSCSAQTSSVWQLTTGFWKRIYKGDYGTAQFGAQYSFTRRDSFSDHNGINPNANDNIAMISFRYYPF